MRLSPQLRVELARFTVTGIAANIVNYLTYVLCVYLSAGVFVASLAGYSLGLLVSYQLGRRWVFEVQNKATGRMIGLFILIYCIGGLGMSFITEFFANVRNIDYRISWLAGAAFAVMNNFLGSKFLVFKRKK